VKQPGPLLKILTVFGTRPEAIKLAPVIRELARHPETFTSKLCVTAQHRQMLDQVLTLFALEPDYDLDVMQAGQSPLQVLRVILERLEPLLSAEQPDWVLVQGDTTTVMAAALAAFHHRIRIGHVEAGLRTRDKYQPFPEEINRRVTDVIADLYFAPTETARRNLLREAIDDRHILVTGNTVIDALRAVAAQPYAWESGPLAVLPRDRRLILVTAHRRENFGEPLLEICGALRDLAARYAGNAHLVYPVHHNPNVREVVYHELAAVPNITLLPPLDYLPMVQLLRRATLVLTDSGGLQEEAPAFGVPVLVLRQTTERPEAVEAGVARVVGAARERIVAEASCLLDDPVAYRQMARAVNPFGDGHAAERIVSALVEENAEHRQPIQSRVF
jgi:UDP-N-acetylglucosamine 2-epimerase (non-hydrolysing)